MISRLWLLGLAALAGACGARGEAGPGTPPPVEAALTPKPADSLILKAPDGVTVWLSEGREAEDSSGIVCLERTLEIRRDSVRIKVPLLYTVTTPVLLNDSTIRARLADHCRPAEYYRVNLRSGRPTPEQRSN